MERRIVALFLSIFFIFSISVKEIRGQEKGNNQSIFWEISGKDLSKPSYLFGTFHLLNKNYLNKFTEWKKKLNSSDAVMVEMVLDSSKIMDMVAKMVSPDTTLDKLLSASEYKLASEYFKEVSGSDLSTLNSLKPLSLSVVLTTFTWAKLRPEDYVRNDLPMDLLFVQEGKDRAKTIIPLETMGQQLSLLYDGISLKRQKDILMEMVQDKKKTEEGILKMDTCYRNQDLDCLQNLIYSSESYKEEELNKLLKNRNLNWMKTIKSTIGAKSTFIAVGAGHLPGEDGLINLLRKEGYTVTPIVL